MLIPGVGMWPPRRYTASSPSVNRTRLRRSGTRNMFTNASSSLFMITFALPALLCYRAEYLGRSAGFANLRLGRFRKMVRFHRNLTGQRARAQDLETVVQLVDDSRRHQTVGRERIAFQLLQPAQVDDGEPLLKNVGEPALRQPAVQRHLAAFEAALLAETGARVLPLGTARRGLPVPRSHAAADALLGLGLSGGGFELTQIHKVTILSWPQMNADERG